MTYEEKNTGNDHVLFLFILEEKTSESTDGEPAVSMPLRYGPAGAGSASTREAGVEQRTTRQEPKNIFFCRGGGGGGGLVSVREKMVKMTLLLFKENNCAKVF